MKSVISTFVLVSVLAGALPVAASAATVPCEDMLAKVRKVEPEATKLNQADRTKFAELEAKGIERCTADDDKRANKFFSDAIALLNK